MSSTFDNSLGRAIESHDSEAVVGLLEPRITGGVASEGESLLCGVLLLLPPFADYMAATRIFDGMLTGGRKFEASVWDAYRYAVLMPAGDLRFEKGLRTSPHSAVAAHMLCLVAGARADEALSLEEGRRSRRLRLFPNNIVEALRKDGSLTASSRDELWRTACDLIVSTATESDRGVRTVEAALQRHWDNLILGTRLTTPLWNEYRMAFGSP